MNLRVILQDVKKFETEALVVGCYEDVRPLKGLAGELDWLLCGSLSDLLIANRIRGSLGDVALITPRGKIPVQKLFMIGLGPRRDSSPATVRAFARTVASSVLDAGVTSAALEYLPASGHEEDLHVQALHDGLQDGSRGRTIEVSLLVQDATSYERVSRMVNPVRERVL